MKKYTWPQKKYTYVCVVRKRRCHCHNVDNIFPGYNMRKSMCRTSSPWPPPKHTQAPAVRAKPDPRLKIELPEQSRAIRVKFHNGCGRPPPRCNTVPIVSEEDHPWNHGGCYFRNTNPRIAYRVIHAWPPAKNTPAYSENPKKSSTSHHQTTDRHFPRIPRIHPIIVINQFGHEYPTADAPPVEAYAGNKGHQWKANRWLPQFPGVRPIPQPDRIWPTP